MKTINNINDYVNPEERVKEGIVVILHNLSEKDWFLLAKLAPMFYERFGESASYLPIGFTNNKINEVIISIQSKESTETLEKMRAYIEGFLAALPMES